jgi:hypothetical protein
MMMIAYEDALLALSRALHLGEFLAKAGPQALVAALAYEQWQKAARLF